MGVRGRPIEWDKCYSSARWARIRRHQLVEHALCKFCLERGIVEPATIYDHIEPHRGDVNKFWLGPFMSLCKRIKRASARWSRSGPPPPPGRGRPTWRRPAISIWPARREAASPIRARPMARRSGFSVRRSRRLRQASPLRELLIELAAEVALNRERAAGDGVALRVRAPISGRAIVMGPALTGLPAAR